MHRADSRTRVVSFLVPSEKRVGVVMEGFLEEAESEIPDLRWMLITCTSLGPRDKVIIVIVRNNCVPGPVGGMVHYYLI